MKKILRWQSEKRSIAEHLKNSDTPIEEIKSELLTQANVRLLVKREDLNHPFISGNKFWKLKYNLEAAKEQGHDTLLTFGGAFSNHIYATAAAAHEAGFKSIGVIRGEETLPLNPTLHFAREHRMQLHYVSREVYRKKDEPSFVNHLKELFGNFYLIPEGGTNALAVKGCAEFAEALKPIHFNYLCLPVGTGGTIAGIIRGTEDRSKILGFSVLKKGEFLIDHVRNLVNDISKTNWSIITDYHFGGYAKKNETLLSFIDEFEKETSIPLDHVYTGKMFFGIYDLIKKNFFEKGSTLLVIHTGGLQGKLKRT